MATTVITNPLTACYVALRTALISGNGGSTGMFADRVYSQRAVGDPARPYVIMSHAAGGQTNMSLARDIEYIIDIDCIADDFDTAAQGAAMITAIIDDSGTYNSVKSGKTALNGGVDWSILTVTEEQTTSLIDSTDKTQPIYMVGARYRVNLWKL